MEPKFIRIRGARMHNLKGIDVDLPRNSLVVFTGLSGSGKSTLAFDTLYAEGQRRYVESLSTYARQFLGQMEKPEVDSLEGLSPAVSIEQRGVSRNPRSTVGTVTEIYDYLRLLFARVGHPHCPDCGKEIKAQSIQDMVGGLMACPGGTKVILLSPLVDGRKGEHREVLARLRKEGFVRIRIDGAVKSLDEEIELEKNKRHRIEAVVDRLVIKPAAARRLADSVATAVALSGGFLLVEFPDDGREVLFSEHSACIKCGRSMPELSPRLFSFNNPNGACPECGGLGSKPFFDPGLVVADPGLSIREGAIVPWGGFSDKPAGRWRRYSGKKIRTDSFTAQIIDALAGQYNFDLDTPFKDLSRRVRQVILYGTGDREINFRFRSGKRILTYQAPFEGVMPQLARRYRETASPAVHEELNRYMNEQPCPSCKGARLRTEALAVSVAGLSIYNLTTLSIADLALQLGKVRFNPQETIIAEGILKEIMNRLAFLKDVGLGYLSLDRRAGTLSGGEAQRIKLASQIGSRLAGVLYILDEPSIGLHQRDNQRLINTLNSLRDLGNTVVVVEHDAETILSADHVLDIGPGAGTHGGRVLYSGPVAGLMTEEKSITGAFLSGRRNIPVPPRRRSPGKFLEIKNAVAHNLKNITVKLPIGVMTCVTGVSGSGKSSLVLETLFKEVMRYNRRGGGAAGVIIKGIEMIDRVIDIDQRPIGRTPRSNPATYTGVLTPIRSLFSQLPEARARGYRPGRFSFNLKGGRCEACEGDGVIKIAMHFLPDIYVTCETCKGKRYNEETMDIEYRGKNIAQVLSMNVEEAHGFFSRIPAIKKRLQTLMDVGLSYIALGQSSVTLSGGEAQRIKLARELGKRGKGHVLYILDEPTTGLHPADIEHLLAVLGRLVDNGNSVVIIEHNLDVIKTADYIIDLGPEGGDGGGRVVAAGTPEEIARNQASHTGVFLKKVLSR